jgi:hypothetical protein
MKKQLLIPVSTMVLLFVVNSCQLVPFPPPGQSVPFKVTDLEGKKLEEAAGGTAIKLESAIFGSLNTNGQLIKEGKIVIDDIEVPIKEVKGDIILLTLPIMYYIDPAYVRMGLLYRGRRYELCLECLLYTPTVTGTIFAGRPGGVPDGTFNSPSEITNDAAGNLYLIDQRTAHDRILKVTTTGITTTLAGGADEFGRLVGIAIDESRGRLYVSDATSQQIKFINPSSPSSVSILAGNGMAGNDDGTGSVASFNFGNESVTDLSTNERGQGLTIDASGNLYVGEKFISSAPHASQIRKCSPEGLVSTVLGSRIEPTGPEDPALPSGLTVKNDNTIFYTTGSSGFFQGIVQITSSGSASRLAGKISYENMFDGRGINVEFAYIKAIKYFSDYLYVADGRNGALRRVSSTGEVISLAGVGNTHTASTCGCGPIEPAAGSFTMVSPIFGGVDYYTTTRERAGQIRMDIAGGVTVVNRNLIYVTDCGYDCIWQITIR